MESYCGWRFLPFGVSWDASCAYKFESVFVYLFSAVGPGALILVCYLEAFVTRLGSPNGNFLSGFFCLVG